MTTLFVNDRANFPSDIFMEGLNELTKIETLKHEIRLIKLVQHLSEKRWDDALHIATTGGNVSTI